MKPPNPTQYAICQQRGHQQDHNGTYGTGHKICKWCNAGYKTTTKTVTTQHEINTP